LTATSSRSRGGCDVFSESINSRAGLAITETALSKTASLRFDGLFVPLSFRTNCRAASRISSSGRRLEVEQWLDVPAHVLLAFVDRVLAGSGNYQISAGNCNGLELGMADPSFVLGRFVSHFKEQPRARAHCAARIKEFSK
jgi:hypothetical protein